jgi:hypothetical protein
LKFSCTPQLCTTTSSTSNLLVNRITGSKKKTSLVQTVQTFERPSFKLQVPDYRLSLNLSYTTKIKLQSEAFGV